MAIRMFGCPALALHAQQPISNPKIRRDKALTTRRKIATFGTPINDGDDRVRKRLL